MKFVNKENFVDAKFEDIDSDEEIYIKKPLKNIIFT